jgi:hypothetical protein
VSTKGRHLSSSWARLIQSMPPHPNSLKSILVQSSVSKPDVFTNYINLEAVRFPCRTMFFLICLRLGLLRSLFPCGVPTKTPYSFFSTMRATCLTHLLTDFVSLSASGKQTNKTNSVAFSPLANYADWATTAGRKILVPTFAARGLTRGQRGGCPWPFISVF